MINKDIKKALKHENRKALKFQSKIKPQNDKNDSMLMSNGFNNNNSRGSSREASKPRLENPEGGFAKSRGIVMTKKKVNMESSNKQYERTENLRPIIQIEHEEFDNQLNIKPQTAQDLYFNKLQTLKIKNELVQTRDDNISRDIQTDAIDERNMALQAPEDLFTKDDTKKEPTVQDLDAFVKRVTPVMEMVCDENVQLRDFINPEAKNKNAVEQKAMISCPNDLLKVLGGKISHISCTHSFETAPNKK